MSSGPGTGAVRRATPADKTATTAASSSRPASKAKGNQITLDHAIFSRIYYRKALFIKKYTGKGHLMPSTIKIGLMKSTHILVTMLLKMQA